MNKRATCRLILAALATAACGNSTYWVNAALDDARGGQAGRGSGGSGLGGGSDGGVGGAQGICEPSQATPELCAELPHLRDAVVDGELECAAALRPVEGGVSLRGNITPPLVDYAIAWTDGGIYWFVAVQDATLDLPQGDDAPYCGDSIELFVDDDGDYQSPPLYDAPGTIHVIIPRGAGGVEPVLYRESTEVGVATGLQFVTRERSGGWTAEVVIDARQLGLASWTPTLGSRVGFNLAVNYGDSSGAPGLNPECRAPVVREDEWLLRGMPREGTCEGQPYCDVRTFCNPVLR